MYSTLEESWLEKRWLILRASKYGPLLEQDNISNLMIYLDQIVQVLAKFGKIYPTLVKKLAGGDLCCEHAS